MVARSIDVWLFHITAMTTIVAYYMPTVVQSDLGDSNCGSHFDSGNRKTGTFGSPRYSNSPPSEIVCRYTFEALEKERVQIYFIDFNLGGGSTEFGDQREQSCDDANSIRVLSNADGILREIGDYCGTKRPPKLMSSDTKMEIIFTLRRPSSGSTFLANYSFVTDFGIKMGVQKNDKSCSFIFDSKRASNGTLTSPNYPGLYPRNVLCHYLFHGQDNERVHIKFIHLDVEGYMPGCQKDTQSDYIEFSNFNVDVVDRKMSRLCGSMENLKTRDEVKSDADFFRITFKSNDVFDGTGFEAFYQFTKVVDVAASGPTMKTQSAAVSARRRTSRSSVGLVAMATLAGTAFLSSHFGRFHLPYSA